MKTIENSYHRYRRFTEMLAGLLLAGMCFHGCYEDTGNTPVLPVEEETAELSIRLKDDLPESRAGGDYPVEDEKKIYSLEVLVFNSDGTLDAYASIPRTVKILSGYNEFNEIEEIKNITITKGTKNIYIVANTPDNSLNWVTTREEFIKGGEDVLERQGIFKTPATNYQTGDDLKMTPWYVYDSEPIGSVEMSLFDTNLTMCGFMENVVIDGDYDHYYLGYTTSSGLPSGVTNGGKPKGNTAFELERLVARVAVKDITFNLSPRLGFGGALTSVYEPWITGFFVMGARYNSYLLSPYDNSLGWTPSPVNDFSYAYGCEDSRYSFFANKLTLVAPRGENSFFLCEELLTQRYNIESAAQPLWFYVFENEANSNYPTYLIIEVEYRYKNESTGVVGSEKNYYAAEFYKSSSSAKPRIQRNRQYRLSIRINTLSNLYYNNSSPAPSRSESEKPCIEIEMEEGDSLFPWTGNIYK